MINYRSLKKLLGETSLERKCRLLFGVALMILITTSFWIYAGLTRQLVERAQILRAEALVPEMLWRQHMERYVVIKQFPKELVSSIDKQEELEPDRGQPKTSEPPMSTAKGDKTEDPPSGSRPPPPTLEAAVTSKNWIQLMENIQAIEGFKIGGSWNLTKVDETPDSEEAHKAMMSFENGGTELHLFVDEPEKGRQLLYFRALRATHTCVQCHKNFSAPPPIPGATPDEPDIEPEGELMAMASVKIPMGVVEYELSRNRAILLAFGIVTTFVAMMVAYVIVRYIIVKPVQHLKEVSDEIARGNLNLRAEINTGDEFEELSQAFNRMLRHMTTVNEEQRVLNNNLDGKVDQLAQANMELFRSNALKDEFLATMSHELRTPLNSILGFSDVLGNAANLDDRQKRYVDNIRTSGRNLMVQINDLLDIAKIESGQMKLQPGPVNLMELIDTQCSQIMPLADQKNIELRVRHLSRTTLELHQDGGKIRQILTNLLSNAIKFTPEGGRVRVTTDVKNDDTVEICVEDTGIGIPMHEQSEIFEKFRQGTTTSGERDHVKREFGGTGLGLSIVRELSRLLGGDVRLESEFGKGSMFTVQIPREAPPEKPPTQTPLDSPSESGRGSITSVDLLNPKQPASDKKEAAGADSSAESDERGSGITQKSR